MNLDTNFRDKKFTIGRIVIVVFSLVTGLLHVGVLFLFGIPLVGLVLGVVLVWLARVSVKTKIFWTVIPIPIIFAVFFTLIYINRAEPEIFVIPRNFRGQFIVFFNEPCGKTPDSENGKRVYYIPDSGVLIIKSKRTTGVLDRQFYIVEEFGSRTKIPEFGWSEYEKESSSWRWYLSTQDLTKDTVGVFWAYTNEVSYIVSTYRNAEIDGRSWLTNRERFWDRAESEIEQCRNHANQ